MANRWFNQFRFSLEKKVVDLFAKVAVGSSGAATVTRAQGVASVVRNSAGNYTVTLQDKYNALLNSSITLITPTGAPAAPQAWVVSEDVAGAKTIIVQFAAAGVATDPASGESFMVKLSLSNTSLNP